MSKYDEFDLDVQNLKGNEGAQEKGVTGALVSIVTGSILTGCSDNCVTANDCSKGCTDGYSASCVRSQCPPC